MDTLLQRRPVGSEHRIEFRRLHRNDQRRGRLVDRTGSADKRGESDHPTHNGGTSSTWHPNPGVRSSRAGRLRDLNHQYCLRRPCLNRQFPPPVPTGNNKSRMCPVANRVIGGDGGIRTLDRALQPYNGLANRRLQPLGHISGTADMPDTGARRKRQIASRGCL